MITVCVRFWVTALILAIGIGFNSRVIFAITLTEIDRVLATSNSLDDFLNSPNQQERYFKALQEYYGNEKFDRTMYDHMLNQLRELQAKVPEVAIRFWEIPDQRKFFKFQSSVVPPVYIGPPHGITFERAREGPFRIVLDAFGTRKNSAHFYRDLVTLKKKFHDLNKKLKNLNGRQSTQLQSAFYQSLKRDPNITQLAQWELNTQLNDLLRSLDGSSEGVITTFQNIDNFKRNPSVILGSRQHDPVLRFLANVVRDLVPSSSEIIAQHSTLFASRSNVLGDLELKPLPRRIHGVWKGIPLKECVGGSECHNLTPERWATVALKDTDVLNLERQGRYVGYVQVVPILGPDGKIYSSVDFGATHFAETFSRQFGESTITAPLYEHFLAQYAATMPQSWGGVVFSDSTAINNANVLTVLHKSAEYKNGRVLGSPHQFSHLDTLGSQIIAASPRHALVGSTSDHIGTYSNRMIFDAFVKNATELKLFPIKTELAQMMREPQVITTYSPQTVITTSNRYKAEKKRYPLKTYSFIQSENNSNAQKLIHAQLDNSSAFDRSVIEFINAIDQNRVTVGDWAYLQQYMIRTKEMDIYAYRREMSVITAMLKIATDPRAPAGFVSLAYERANSTYNDIAFTQLRKLYEREFQIVKEKSGIALGSDSTTYTQKLQFERHFTQEISGEQNSLNRERIISAFGRWYRSVGPDQVVQADKEMHSMITFLRTVDGPERKALAQSLLSAVLNNDQMGNLQSYYRLLDLNSPSAENPRAFFRSQVLSSITQDRGASVADLVNVVIDMTLSAKSSGCLATPIRRILQ